MAHKNTPILSVMELVRTGKMVCLQNFGKQKGCASLLDAQPLDTIFKWNYFKPNSLRILFNALPAFTHSICCSL